MYLILGVLASDVVIFRFNPSSDNLYVPLSSPEIILYFIVLLWVADKEMTTVYPPSEIDKRQTSPNANVTKVTTVSVDIFMFFDTDFMFGIGKSPPRRYTTHDSRYTENHYHHKHGNLVCQNTCPHCHTPYSLYSY